MSGQVRVNVAGPVDEVVRVEVVDPVDEVAHVFEGPDEADVDRQIDKFFGVDEAQAREHSGS